MGFDGFAVLAAKRAEESRQVRRAKSRVRIPKPVVVDSETFGVEDPCGHAPVPTLWSIKYPGKKARYYAYGHASGNNCTWADAKEALDEAWAWPDGVLFHNCKFDLAAAYEHMDMPFLPPERCHDSLFLAYLDDPNQREIGLKPLGQRLLGLPPEERDAVADWLVEHQPVPGVRISRSTSSQAKAPFMAFLPFAPGDVVGPYAVGDVERTEKVFAELYRSVVAERGMGEAYDRERGLVPVLMENERHGIRVDVERLRADVARYRAELDRIRAWMLKKLGVKDEPDFNVDSAEQVVARMFERGMGDPVTWPQTPKSTPAKPRYATGEEVLVEHCTDRQFAAVWAFKGKLSWALSTCLENWLAVAERSGGRIFTDWHQTRGSEGGGARTGRLSSSPNFQNLSPDFTALFREHEDDAARAKTLPRAPWPDLLRPPNLRSYILPDEGHVLIGRDFSSQELRILAHFEQGPMLKAYREKPDTDFHQFAADLITRLTGIKISRKAAKTIAFSILYGSGIAKLSASLGVTVAEATTLKKAYLDTFPGIKKLQDALKVKAKLGQPMYTLGGREFYCEEPAFVEGKLRTFEYKLLNTLIQGSAADQTKEAMIRFRAANTNGRLLLSVHDELIVSAPAAEAEAVMAVLKRCMEEVELDAPMLSDGEMGDDWGHMREAA